jgi:hypothetical protein
MRMLLWFLALSITMLLIFVLGYASRPNDNMNNNNFSFDIEERNAIVVNIWIDSYERLDVLRRNNMKYLFVDVGGVDKNGFLMTSDDDVKSFVNFIKEYERDNSYDFVILPYVEVNSNHYNVNGVFLSNFVDENVRLNQMGFDGVHVDIEPVPRSLRKNFLLFLDELNEHLPDAIISVYSGHPGRLSFNVWEWEISFFKEVSARSDIIVFPAYDTYLRTQKEFKNDIEDKIKKISAQNWDSDFMVALPTHKRHPETLENAYKAYKEGLPKYREHPFIGVAIFSEWTITESDWSDFSEISKIKNVIYLN